MQGRSHVISGALLWLGVATPAAAMAGAPLRPGDVAGGVLACAGAALLPDIDHPQSTLAHALGPVSHLVAKVVHAVSGGHRCATHSLGFAVLTGGGLLYYGHHGSGHRDVMLGVLFVLSALAMKSLKMTPMRWKSASTGLVCAVQAAILTAAVAAYDKHSNLAWMGVAVGLGCLAHCAGDMLTPGGVPFLWPWKRKFAIPFLPSTGSFSESLFATVMLGGDIALAWYRFGGAIPGT